MGEEVLYDLDAALDAALAASSAAPVPVLDLDVRALLEVFIDMDVKTPAFGLEADPTQEADPAQEADLTQEDHAPWHQQPEETAAAYRAFCSYRDLGAGRSLLSAYNAERQRKGKEKAKHTPGTWTRWYTVHHWRARAEGYDGHLDQARRREYEATWKARARQIAEDQWALSQQAIEKVRQMLRFPLVEQHTDQATGAVILKPAKWDLGTAARLMKEAVWRQGSRPRPWTMTLAARALRLPTSPPPAICLKPSTRTTRPIRLRAF